MGVTDRPEGGDIETYRAAQAAKAEKQEALTEVRGQAQTRGNEAGGVAQTVKDAAKDNKK